jgi:hypothetical protein
MNQINYFDLASGRYPLLHIFCTAFNRITGIILPLILHPFPRCVSSVVTVVGAPLHLPNTHGQEPSEEQQQEAMSRYVEALETLYRAHAPLHNSCTSRPLIIT